VNKGRRRLVVNSAGVSGSSIFSRFPLNHVSGRADRWRTVLEADSLLSGTFELFPLAEVLGLIERAAVSGVLSVRGREIDGSLYFVDGALCAGEIGDVSGPVEGQQALEIRLLEVAVPLLRARAADFEFRPDVTPPWPAPLAVPIATVFEPARLIAREWSAIMTAIESFESVLERTGQITTDSITLSHLGFRILEQIDGTSSIREIARRAGASLVAVGPEVRTLVLSGAVRVIVDAERALATARAHAERDRPGLESMLDMTATTGLPLGLELAAEKVVEGVVEEPVVGAHVVAARVVGEAAAEEHVVETMTPAEDPDDLARERASLAAMAGLSDPGPVPDHAVAPDAAAPEPERAQIVVDRGELLRMFSGLKDE
jgi:hypothetical protein